MRRALATILIAALATVALGSAAFAMTNKFIDIRQCETAQILSLASSSGVVMTIDRHGPPYPADMVPVPGAPGPDGKCITQRYWHWSFPEGVTEETPDVYFYAPTNPQFGIQVGRIQMRALRATPTPVVR